MSCQEEIELHSGFRASIDRSARPATGRRNELGGSRRAGWAQPIGSIRSGFVPVSFRGHEVARLRRAWIMSPQNRRTPSACLDHVPAKPSPAFGVLGSCPRKAVARLRRAWLIHVGWARPTVQWFVLFRCQFPIRSGDTKSHGYAVLGSCPRSAPMARTRRRLRTWRGCSPAAYLGRCRRRR